jgi:VPDSG-CTERM motif
MRKILSETLTVAIGTLFLGGMSASAQLLKTTTYGGHTYELWAHNGISWVDAEAAAVAEGGTLAVFTTPAETTSVYNTFIGTGFFTTGSSQDIEAWLGARPADGSSSTHDPNNWAWVTGEAWNAYDAGNFDPGEPNGDSSGLAINRQGAPTWNDEGGHVGGYIVEKAVPDAGSSLVLLGGALGLLGMIRRK